MFRLIFITTVIATLSACGTSYPLKMTEGEWAALSPAQQMDARTEQAVLDRQRDQARSQEQIAKAEIEAKREQFRLERIDRLRVASRSGDVIECVIDQATVDFKPGWHVIQPVAVALVRGSAQEITFHPADGARKSKSAWLWFAANGLQAALCLNEPRNGPFSATGCFAVAGTSKELYEGVKINIPQSDWFKGEMRCAIAWSPENRRDFKRYRR